MIIFTPCRFTVEERFSDTHCIGGWASPRALLNAVEKRQIWCSLPEMESRLLSCWRAALEIRNNACIGMNVYRDFVGVWCGRTNVYYVSSGDARVLKLKRVTDIAWERKESGRGVRGDEAILRNVGLPTHNARSRPRFWSPWTFYFWDQGSLIYLGVLSSSLEDTVMPSLAIPSVL